jgi:hypothetical protein
MTNKAKEQNAVNSIETDEQFDNLIRCAVKMKETGDLAYLGLIKNITAEIAELNGIQLDPFVDMFNDYNSEHNDYSPYG